MEVSVWDTYVKREDGKAMSFDILVPSDLKNGDTILLYGNTYLKSKPFKTETLTSNGCVFCHLEQATGLIKEQIENKGFYIKEIRNCG
ncbi:uncharacterized protein DUF2024 [Mariniflexile fucanivorans]|uniref:Uncharacterized protein DUF2024 n=1 Tax=Mariniflexile fucanivorans TaxID=264023 RepID=A0A4R1RRT6_9FLAO|nr:DUF2024 family protein [Mariniflexile fucanivorans]TCL68750.1 uncharacterized protein DUF2024 [Mariniflexile fucanivorans]